MTIITQCSPIINVPEFVYEQSIVKPLYLILI